MADIEFLEAIGQPAADMAIEESVDALGPDLSLSIAEVKSAAEAVLLAATHLRDQALSQKNLESIMQQTYSDAAMLELSVEMQKSDIQSQEGYKYLMEKVFILQNIVNEWIGQKVQMVYVYKGQGGDIELWKVDNTVDDLSIGRGSKSHGGYVNGRYQLSKKKLLAFMNEGKASLLENEAYDPTTLKLTYSEILQRKKIAKSVVNGGTFYILWNEGDGWHGVRVSSEGVLAEAYAGFYLNGVVFESNMETNVRIFMTDPAYGAIQVDNQSGFLAGDVVQQGSSVQYGIKTKGASAMGYLQVVQMASQIYQECMRETPDLTSLLSSMKQTLKDEGTTKLANNIADMSDEVITKLIEQYLKIGK